MLTAAAWSQTKAAASSASQRLISAVPMAFEQNDGQLAPGLAFLGRAQSYSVGIERGGLRFFIPGAGADADIDVRFAGSHGGSPVALSGIAYRSNYFIGSDRTQWHAGVANFSRVGVRGIYPGIDTEFYDRNGELEHDFVVAPGGDPAAIRLDVQSSQRAQLTAEGDAVIPSGAGELRFRKPVAYQYDAQGKRVAVDASYRLKGTTLRLALGGYDRSRTLVIDPVIVFATYIAGTAGSTPAQVTTDGDGTIFVAGSAASSTGFPPLPNSAPTGGTVGTGPSNVFVAELTSTQLGSTLEWLTFLGNAGTSKGTSLVYSTHRPGMSLAGTLFVGGTTSAGSFPGVPASGAFDGTFPSSGTDTIGFVSALNAQSGDVITSTYIATGPASSGNDTTTVSALAADPAGDVYIAGYGQGIGLGAKLTDALGTATGATSIIPANAGTTNNAFVIELDPALSTASLVTYLQSSTAGDYKATAIQIDGASPANIYVAGTVGGTSVQFPSAQSFHHDTGTEQAPLTLYSNASDFPACTKSGSNTSAFAAQIVPPSGSGQTNSALGFAMFTCADGSDTAQGLALGATGLYLAGNTSSKDLETGVSMQNNTGILWSNTGNAAAVAALSGGLQTTSNPRNGYIVKAPVSSTFVVSTPSAFTYLGGAPTSAGTTLNGVAIDDTNHLLQVVGQTDSTRLNMPAHTAATLPAGQDASADNLRGFLYSFDDSRPPFLSAVKSISYLGNTTTGSSALSVALDGSAGAYVLAQDSIVSVSAPATPATSFLSADAAGSVPAAAASPGSPNAYLAHIQRTDLAAGGPGLTPSTFTADSTNLLINGSPCDQYLACVVANDGNSTVTYQWNVNPAKESQSAVFNFPPQSAFALSPAYTIKLDGQQASSSGTPPFACATKPQSNGTTCTVAPLSANGTPHTLTVEGTVVAAASGNIIFDGNVADAEGEFADAPQSKVIVAAPVSITLAFTENGGAGPLTVNASKDNTGTGGTTVVYQAVVKNTSANDSPYTSLKITGLPPASQFLIQSITATGMAGGTCDTTAGTGCSQIDLAAGATLTYAVTGIYLGPGFGTTNSGPYPFTLNASATALPLTSTNKQQNATPLVTNVNGVSALSITNPAPTYPTGQTYFSLGDAGKPATFKITVTNNGTNAAGQFVVANTLPTGFHVTSATCSPSVATCNSDGTGFTPASLAAGGVSILYTVVGYFSDHGAAGGDAVPTNVATSTVTDSATISAQPAGTFDAGIPVTATTTAINVQRSVHLKIALSTTGSLPAGSYPNQPAFNMGTGISYNYTITNTGPSIDFNVPLTNVFTTPIPASYVTVTTPTGGAVNCPGNVYTTCTITSVPGQTGSTAGSASFTFTVVYPDLPTPPLSPPPAVLPDFEAVPSYATNAAYTYQGTMTAVAYAVDISPNPADNQSNFTVNVYRTAALSFSPVPAVSGFATTCASGSRCFYMANSSSTSDTATYTVAIQNGGPNVATGTTLTIPLPTNFLVTADPTVSFTGLAAPGVPNELYCSYQSSSNSVVCTGYVPLAGLTATVTSKYSTATVPANAPSITVTAPTATQVSASAINASNSTTLPAVEVDRAAALVAAKLVNSAPGNVSPNGFAINGTLAVNLDEKVAADANGKNDTVAITQEVGNAGLNDATGVIVTDTLPPYFILTQKPSYCTLSGTTTPDGSGNPTTGAAPVTIKCTLPNPVPRGTATAGSGSTHGSPTGSFVQVAYYGKFADYGLQTDAVPQNANSTAVPVQTLSAASTDVVNLGLASDLTSAPTASTPVMRAAHLRRVVLSSLATFPFSQTNDSALLAAGVPPPGIAEAQPSVTAGSSDVFNPMRYKTAIVNDGPNIATHPLLNSALPPNANGSVTFVVQGQSLEPAFQGFPGPATCTGTNACFDGGAITPGAQLVFNLDGYFGVNTLMDGNTAPRTFNSTLTDPTIVDSNPAGTTNGDGTIPAAAINVVNTPVGSGYMLKPFDNTLATPLNLNITSVQAAGVTSLVPNTPPAVPMGPSPNPPDNGATKPLYQFAQNGTYYTLGTTAGVPTGSSNPTTICLNSIPGTFQKPERVLLWALGNAPAGTTFNNVPHFTNTAAMGDITVSVLPQGGGSYTVPEPITSYPPPVQPQPAQVCGVLNGLADAGAPTVLAVMEPVNYAPYVRTQITAANTQFGKGVTAGSANIDLTISPTNNYDYNDADPCYTGSNGSTRSTCNDNVQLTTFIFGGQNLIGDSQQQHSYFSGELQPGSNPPQFNLPAGQPQIYVLLADNVGAQQYPAIGFDKNDPTMKHPLGCDPGTLSATYTPIAPVCKNPPALSVVQNPPQQLPLSSAPGAEVALVGNTGLFGGGSGLIAITEPPAQEATASVTAGQTAGFVWNLLTEDARVQGSSGILPSFTLACASADGKDLASLGIQCSVTPTYVYSTTQNGTTIVTAPPTVYVSTTSNTAVGALHEGPLSRDMRIVAAILFPVGAVPLLLLARRRKTLRLSGWLAVIFLAALMGLGIGCGSGSSFKSQGGTTTTATAAGTYQFVVTASGTDSSGNPIDIKSPAFAVTVTAVH